MTETPRGGAAAERALDELLREAHLAAPYQLPGLVARHAAALGGMDAVIHLADLQQQTLVPFLPPDAPAAEPLGMDSTVAGRAFQLVEVLRQRPDEHGRHRVWLPLLDGTERVGVLLLVVAGPERELDGPLGERLRRFAGLVAQLVMTKSMYGDVAIRLRRRSPMGLAAELQWSLLPPLTFSCHEITIAAALEPAYEVAGDVVDYAVDAGRARAAVFDSMGHGLSSAQLAALAVAAYRNGRRSGLAVGETAEHVHTALLEAAGGGVFCTALLIDLDTDTGLLRWVSAGHPEPLLLRDGRLVKTLHTPPCLPLGLKSPTRLPVTVGVEHLQAGDRVLLYTDGVTEARSPSGDFFGEQRLADLLSRNLAAGLPTPETMRRVVRALLAHQEGRLDDDASLLLLEWRGSGAEDLVP